MKTNIQKITGQITLALFALAAASVNLHAATLTVTNTADSGAGTLRAALTSANNGDTINFALPTPAQITLTSGELLVSNSVSILGPGANNLAVDGNAASRIFHVTNTVAAIAGLTITNGYANSSPGSGGGVLNDRAGLTISNCIITGNKVPNGGGGGILNYGVAGGRADLLVVNSTLIGNSVTNGSGGGIDNEALSGSVANVQLSNSTLNDNSAFSGGGFSSLYANNCTGFVQIINCTLSGNSARTGGSGSGGGIYYNNFSSTSTSSVSVVNCTVSGNSADYYGQGIYIGNNGGKLSVNVFNSTLIGNSRVNAAYPAALWSDNALVNIGSTILNNDFNIYSGPFVSLGYNLVSDSGVTGVFTNATDQINTDPMLGPLQDNGGPTFTHAPLPGSPAIDRGKNFSASATDQRGLPRTFDKAAIANAAGGDGTDIGAVESQSYTVVNTNDSGAGSLRQAIADSNAQPGTNTIDFAPSAYGTILLTSGELLITNNVFITGSGATNELVNGNAADRVFEIAPSNVVAISCLTITNGGNTSDPTNGTFNGGGIFANDATLTISNCVVSGNRCYTSGGGIYNAGSYRASLTVLSSTVSGNSAAPSGYGGGIGNFANGAGNIGLHLTNSIISGNRAGPGGGGIYSRAGNTSTAKVEVMNCTVMGNSNGGLMNEDASSQTNSLASLIVINSTLCFNTNHAIVNSLAAGILNRADLLIQNSTISSNFSGSAVYAQQQIYNRTNTTVTILNSTIIGNAAPAISGNWLGTFVVGSSILNNGPVGINNDNGGPFTSLGYNLCCNGAVTNATDQQYTDPLLGSLQDNGGPTFTHAPLPGSPARDSGTNFSGSATDQRGFKRTLGGGDTDVGAVQSQDMSLRLVKAGVVSNQFGFRLVGPFTNVVVEASTNLSGSNWTALATNTLGDAALRFNDPSAPTLPKRFYRARVQ